MKQVRFYSLPEIIKSNDYKLTFDGDKSDLRLHSESTFNWGGKNNREYKAACKAIDNISYKGDGWQLYAWYDVSSYEYWMKKQQEQNYIQITIAFDKKTIKDTEIPIIVKALDYAIADADAIQNKYSFNPSFD